MIVVIHGASDPRDVPGLDRLDDDVVLRAAPTVDALRTALPGAEVVLGWDFRAGALEAAWGAADRLRWIHWAAAGVDATLFPALVDSPITLTNARGVFDRPVAEYVLGLVVAMAKDLPRTVELQLQRTWRHRLNEPLDGSCALVVGVGGIGRETARLLSAVGMNVTAVGRRARSADPDFGTVHGPAALDRLLPDADFVVLCAPLTPATRHMFDAERFRRMRPTARLINVGRGALVCEQALVGALQDGLIAGAALDVFENEPLAEQSPLWTLPGVIVSPHMAGDYAGFERALAAGFLENLERYRRGLPLVNVVDKALGYAPS